MCPGLGKGEKCGMSWREWGTRRVCRYGYKIYGTGERWREAVTGEVLRFSKEVDLEELAEEIEETITINERR